MVKIQLKTGKEIYLDGYLVPVLETLIYNIKKDWDFVIVITGDRMVRTGKSVIGLSIGAYLADKLNTPFTGANVFFDSQSMMNYARVAPKNSVLMFDEGREALASTKAMMAVQRDLLDYFSECGQLNHIFIIILPDFFGLKEDMAVARSEFLINVYRREVPKQIDLYNNGEKKEVVSFERGYFELWNREKKKNLYDIARATHIKSYSKVPPNFRGRFTNVYPIDEEEYRELKLKALKRYEDTPKYKQKEIKLSLVGLNLIIKLANDGLTGHAIANKLLTELNIKYEPESINNILKLLRKKSEKAFFDADSNNRDLPESDVFEKNEVGKGLNLNKEDIKPTFNNEDVIYESLD